MSVTLFDNLLLMLSDRPPQQCGMLGFCTAQLVVEADGSVYPCDFSCVGSVLLRKSARSDTSGTFI